MGDNITNYIDELEEELRMERTHSRNWEADAKRYAENADYWRERCEEAERCRGCDGKRYREVRILTEDLDGSDRVVKETKDCSICHGSGRDRGPKEK